MRKLKLVIHLSLDGFVAGENGDFDELTQSPENLEFVCNLTDSADALLAGRVSFEMLDIYWPTAHLNPNASKSEIKYSKWYNQAEKIVLSRSMSEKKRGNAVVLSDNIEDRLLQIKKTKGKDILLFGSPSVFKTLTKLNLIDEYWIIMYPVILGKGFALFDSVKNSIKLKRMDSRLLSQGEIAIQYKVEK